MGKYYVLGKTKEKTPSPQTNEKKILTSLEGDRDNSNSWKIEDCDNPALKRKEKGTSSPQGDPPPKKDPSHC